MSELTIQIPDSLHRRLDELARDEGVSVDRFVESVLARRIAVAEADPYLRIRAKRGSAETLLAILEEAPDTEPEPHDRMPGDNSRHSPDR